MLPELLPMVIGGVTRDSWMGKPPLIFRTMALVPLPFLALGPVLGGGWALVALFYLSIFAFFADETLVAGGETVGGQGRLDVILADAVPVILGVAHLLLLPMAILFLSRGDAGRAESLMIFLAYALFFGTISTANAHELIHRPDWFRASLGKWIFVSLLFGHHVSAHLAVHHRHVATPQDPNTAHLNEGFYHFFRRAWLGSYFAGMAAENDRARLGDGRGTVTGHPYFIYIAGALVFLALALAWGGARGVAIYLGFAIIAQAQLLLSDYVQHYGLERRIGANGKYERVTIRHAWNAPHAFSTALMLNAPRHSDHHAHPLIRYSELRTRASDGAPVLPHSIPVMSLVALFPARWRRLMNPLVADWVRQQDMNRRTGQTSGQLTA